MSLLTPENLPAVLTAVGGLVAAIGGITWWRARSEPPKPGTADAVALALAENTKAMQDMTAAMRAQNGHFAQNNEMFKALGPVLGGMAKDISESKHDGAERKWHLAAIRDALNRRAR